jgi:hypothetical protein
MPTQLSVFMENKPGKMDAITGILQQAGINLRGLALASRGDFGVLKLLPDDPDKAWAELTRAGYTVSRRAVAIALIDDRPGSLHELLALLARHRINIDDCYGVSIEKDRTAAIVFDIEAQPDAERVLRDAGIKLAEGLAAP